MKLIRIKATNFKGLSFDEPLSPLTIFVGSNFAGKTARTDAIRLLLLGYLPELGKTPRATFGLASGAEMIVEGEFDDGLVRYSMRRRFYLKGDTVRQDAEIPARFSGVGGGLENFAVMLDASVYFSLSDRERVNYVFGLIQLGEGWKPAAIKDKLAKKFPQATELMDRLESFARDRLTAQEFVEQAINTTAEYWKNTKAYGAKMEQTIQGLSALRAYDSPATSSLPALEDKRAQVARQIADLQERRGVRLGAFTAMKAAEARRKEIERELRFADKARGDLQVQRNKVTLADAALAELPSAGIMKELRDATAMTTGNCARWDMRVQNAADYRKRLGAEYATLEQAEACPCCGASGQGWKKAKLDEIGALISRADDELAEAQKTRTACGVQNREAQEKLLAAEKTEEKRQQLWDAKHAALREIARLEPGIVRLDGMAEEMTRLAPFDEDLQLDVERMQDELNMLAEEARKLDVQIKATISRAGEVQRLAEAEKERDQARADQEAAAEIGKELRAIQAEMVEAAFKPLLETANSFYQGVLKAPLSYHEGEIGMWRDGTWVAHHTFSGTEKALTYAAIQSALAQKSPCRVMMIDELGRLDDANIRIMLTATFEAYTSGRIDGFVGIDTGRLPLYQRAARTDSAFLVTEVG